MTTNVYTLTYEHVKIMQSHKTVFMQLTFYHLMQ